MQSKMNFLLINFKFLNYHLNKRKVAAGRKVTTPLYNPKERHGKV